RAEQRAIEGCGLRLQRRCGKRRPQRAHPPPSSQAGPQHRRNRAWPGLPPRPRRRLHARARDCRAMSLRLRLSMILGTAFLLLWSLAAAWMLYDLRDEMMRSLDQRLASSARMVARLIAQVPQPVRNEMHERRLSAEQL